MSPVDAAAWPNVRDVAQQLNVSAVYVNRLIHAGRLQAARTRLGFLLDPQSVEDFAAARLERTQRKQEPARSTS